jgi:hypothetical protein
VLKKKKKINVDGHLERFIDVHLVTTKKYEARRNKVFGEDL